MKIRFIIIFISIFYFASCMSMIEREPNKIRNNILKKNSNVLKVGIIKNYTYSDNKYMSIEIVFKNGDCLYLTWIRDWLNWGSDGSFRITRIGNYAFGTYILSSHNEYYFEKVSGIHAMALEKKLNIKLETIQNAISNYDVLYNYILSLPYLDIDNNEQKEAVNNLKLYDSIVYPIVSQGERHYETIYPFRINWKDIYYDYFTSHERRPNYND
jgi:hypothetical protein